MAAVNCYEDIPGGVNDLGSIYEYIYMVNTRITKLNEYLTKANNLNAILELCNGYAKDGKIAIDEGKTCFNDGAYYDGITDFTQQLQDSSDSLNAVTTDMDNLYTKLGTLIEELNADLTFCNDRLDTWQNAATFLEKMASEQMATY